MIPIILRNTIKPVFDVTFRSRKINTKWGGAFNGQKIRRQIFKDIIKFCGVTKIYETGSFRGVTTLFMQKHSNLKIDSIEAQTEYYRYSKLRFLFNSNIQVHHGDSRKKLKELIGEDSHGTVFFYLDAHWAQDLPLGEEIEIIFSRLTDAVILIDDFKVENDPGYKYDDYGPGKALTLEYIQKNTKVLPHIFFPISSENENGSMRGCVVITNNEASAKALQESKSLNQYH